MGVIRETIQDLNRVRQIVAIAARHGFADFFKRSSLSTLLGRNDESATASESPLPAARRFRLLLSDLGPTFIKLGQVLSTRADLLPAPLIEELSHLQDDAPPMPIEVVRDQIRLAFHAEPEEIFRVLDSAPLAAASIAQVHKATTKEGDEVVVKVQRPDIADQIRADLSVLRTIARALEATIEEAGIYSPTGIIDEFERAVRDEMDFIVEADNLRAFQITHQNRPEVRIPRLYEDLSTRTILTMEFIQGDKLSQAPLDAEGKKRVAEIIIDGSFRQLFEDGLFHGDPHPGNLLILPGPTICLLDFGMVGRLSRHMQETLVSLVIAITLRDADTVARLLYRVGVTDGRTNLAALRGDIEGLLSQQEVVTLSQVNAQRMLRSLLDIAVRHRIRVPKEYAVLSRASVSIEGILRSLYPDMNIREVALPYAKKLLSDRYAPEQMEGGAWRALLRLKNVADELPTQLSQILLDLERGRFTVNARSEQMDELNANVRALAVMSFFGMCACGFIVGAFVALSSKHWEIIGIPVLGLAGLVSAGFLSFLANTWYLFGKRVKKVSIQRFIRNK